jgi:hypothetical protein
MRGAQGERVDDLERRSRLVSLVYPVIAALPLPMDGAADVEVYAALASAFHRKVAEAAELSRHANDTRRPHRRAGDNIRRFRST